MRNGRQSAAGLVALFASTVFLSAFLLFQVQPLMSKTILPWFGGATAVWTTCMLFFQTLLFGGYAYAHLLNRRVSSRGQWVIHSSLIAAALLALPITPSPAWKPTGDGHPALHILLLLSASVGLPFFILASTGPLLQSWFARSQPGASPYRLYALSNAGSLLALISYPFLVEPAWDITLQSGIWSAAFVLFGLLCIGCAVWTHRRAGQTAGESGAEPSVVSLKSAEQFPPSPARSSFSTTSEKALSPSSMNPADGQLPVADKPTGGVQVLWFLLAMAASVMLLATTNQVCQDVASVPFLWVMPLTLYLLTFILCFDREKWYSRKWFAIAAAVSVAGVCVVMLKGAGGSLLVQVLIYFAGLFFTCMVCHGELVRLKPAPRHVTAFYLVISAGGAAGGLFVGLLAPLIFPTFLEMHIALFGVWVLALVIFFRDHHCVLYNGRPRWAWGLILLGIFVLAGVLRLQAGITLDHSLAVSRNFYGVLRIEERDANAPQLHRRRLVHGRILHGLQFREKSKRHIPTTYYGRQSGAGLLLETLQQRGPLRVGVVGLGVGTLAVYARPEDRFRFYEINPAVVRLAKKHFTYLRDCRGTVSLVVADARLALEREPNQQFDVLLVDAFSGDAIPAHLLTAEAFGIYRRHLKPDGVLALHISNLYFDLKPVVAAAADRLKWQTLIVQSRGKRETGTKPAIWMLLSRSFDGPDWERLRKAGTSYTGRRVHWTDTRSNLVEILK